MKYRYKYNERGHFENEERSGDIDIPSAKAVRDTLVEEVDGVIMKSRRQISYGREFIVCAEFGTGGGQKVTQLLKKTIDMAADAKNLFA